MLKTSRRLAVLLLTGSLLAPSVAAATVSVDDLDNIVFEGVLRDSAGAVVSGARIVATHTATGVTRTALSNGEGRYRIAVSAPGNYKLKATADGFKDRESSVTEAGRGQA
jgi:Carboxypeptidase regulatory-like domain